LDTVQTEVKTRKNSDNDQNEVVYYETSGVGEVIKIRFGVSLRFYTDFAQSF
jgi:hypothetical protein